AVWGPARRGGPCCLTPLTPAPARPPPLPRRFSPGMGLAKPATDLPLVLPPVTAGVALLMAFGRRGVLGPSLAVLGIELPFTMTAVILAQLFVAGAFFILGGQLGVAGGCPGVGGGAGGGGGAAWGGLWCAGLPTARPAGT